MISWLNRLRSAHPVSDEELSEHAGWRLNAERARAVEAHASGCEKCRAGLAELRALKAMLGALPQEQPRRSFALTPAMAGERSQPAAAPARSRSLAFVPAMAASVLLLLVAVDVASTGSGGSSRDESAGGNFARATSEERAGTGADSAALSVPPSVPSLAARDTTAASQGATPPAAAGAAAPAPAVAGTPGAETPATARQDAGASAGAAAAESNEDRGAPKAAGPQASQQAGEAASDGASGPSTLRVLQALAAAALAASLLYGFWVRRGDAGSR